MFSKIFFSLRILNNLHGLLTIRFLINIIYKLKLITDSGPSWSSECGGRTASSASTDSSRGQAGSSTASNSSKLAGGCGKVAQYAAFYELGARPKCPRDRLQPEVGVFYL